MLIANKLWSATSTYKKDNIKEKTTHVIACNEKETKEYRQAKEEEKDEKAENDEEEEEA